MQTSRRTFLQSTAPALALTWGGLKLYAGHSEAAGYIRPVPAHDFICGSLVYRPPNPPREERREVPRTLSREHHFNLMQAFPTWDYYQRGPNDYSLEEIEELMQYCDEFGLKVLMGVVTETAPYWLELAHPETRWVDSTGQPSRLRGNSSHITGGFPGLCLDWEPVQEAARGFIGNWCAWYRSIPPCTRGMPGMSPYCDRWMDAIRGPRCPSCCTATATGQSPNFENGSSGVIRQSTL